MKFKILLDEVDDNESDLILSMLKAYGINAHKKYTGSAGIMKLYFGNAISGTRIVVEEKDFDKAVEIIEAKPVYDYAGEDD